MARDPRIKFSHDFPEIVQLVVKSLECKFHTDVSTEIPKYCRV